jgi:hypothetical protein
MFPSNSAASPPYPLLLPFEVSFTFITPTQVHDEGSRLHEVQGRVEGGNVGQIVIAVSVST